MNYLLIVSLMANQAEPNIFIFSTLLNEYFYSDLFLGFGLSLCPVTPTPNLDSLVVGNGRRWRWLGPEVVHGVGGEV